MQRFYSLVTIGLVMVCGSLTYAGATLHDSDEDAPIAATHHVDVTHYEYDLDDPETPVQATAELVIVGQAVKAPAKVWTCTNPRPLANDAIQTVRECEWR